MQCQNCGHVNRAEARFCANCGARLVPVAYAGFRMRLGANGIDNLFVCGLILVLTIVIVKVGGGSAENVIVVLYFLVFWPYWWLFTGLRGQTPGKMLRRMKVVDRQGNIPGLWRAALREIVGKEVSTALILGFLWIAWDKQKQGWHDKIAGTYVIKVR